MTYSAVVTTGIYCRPGCPGQPDQRNVRHYDVAAAAEADGFRACLRCRPYREAASAVIAGPELVCRAVNLIVDGALDRGNEATVAHRLGVSSRHLRRMFIEHVGVTPDQLARSRRTHFARRLLDDTDLPVTDIAFAAGFGSVRQFNRACHEIFRATPTALRAKRRKADRLAADGGLSLRLAFRPPLAWDTMLSYLAERAIPGVEHADGTGYRRTIRVLGDPGVIEIFPSDDRHLLLRLHLPHWEGLIHVTEQARRIFNLDGDPVAAASVLAQDLRLAPLLDKQPGLRMPGTWDPYEIGVRAIIGQQISVAAAGTLVSRLVERHGEPIGGLTQLGLTHLFPPPEVLAKADLDGLGLTGSRMATISAFARAVAEGDLPLDRGASLDEMVTALVTLPGVGPWTAQYIALRMGEPDAFPATDLGLLRAAASLGGGADRAPATSGNGNGNGHRNGNGTAAVPLAEWAEAWRPWRGYAAAHLWMG